MSFFDKKSPVLKFIASLLVMMIFISALGLNSLYPPKPAKAQWSTLPQQIIEYIMEIINWAMDYASQEQQEDDLDTISDVQDWFKDDTMDRRSERESWNETRKSLLDELVNDVLSNIQNGANGQEAFVYDWKSFLKDQGKQDFQNFVSNELNQAQICDTFKSEIQQEISAGNEPSYITQAGCPLQDPDAMLNGTSQNFWAEWDNLIRPSGNPFGSYMLADDEKIKEEALGFTSEIYKLTANQGNQGTPDTPGIIQSYAAQRASMMDLDYLLNSDDLEEYFSSVAEAFINKITQQGLSKFNTSAPRPITPNPPQVPPQIANLNFIKNNYSNMLSIAGRLDSVLDNLNKLQALGGNAAARIAQVNQAITDVNALIPLMETVIDLDDQGIASTNPQMIAAVNAAMSAFNTALASLQAILNTTKKDPIIISSLIGDYNKTIVKEANKIRCQRSPASCSQ